MRRRVFLTALVIAMASIVVFAGPALAGRPGTGSVREAPLTGAEVVPGPGDPNGSGLARLIVYPNKHKICTTINVSGIKTATTAHLHQARVGATGPVRLKLTPPRDGTSEHECIRGLARRFIKKIGHNPSNY